MHRRLSLLLLPALAATGLAFAPPAAAATDVYTVTTTDDIVDAGDGLLSRREAIALAGNDAGESEIVLAPGASYPLTICNGSPPEHSNVDGDLDLPADDAGVTITGNGATIDQNCAAERVLLTQQPIVVRNLTITGGDSGSGSVFGEQPGAGIYAYEDVTVEDSRFVGNYARTGASVYAGGDIDIVRTVINGNTGTSGTAGATGVGVTSTVTATDSLVYGNTGGAQLAFSGVDDVVVRNTTITDNDAIAPNTYTSILSANHDLLVQHSTVAGNDLVNGATIYSGTTATITSSIVVNDADWPECHALTPVTTSGGGNLFRDTTCGSQPTDHTGVTNPLLTALADHGGPTMTQVPMSGSTAIDAAACDPTIATDQRGVTRPQGSACDAGAVEVGVAPDGVLRLGTGPWRGDGVHNLTGTGQTRVAVVHRGGSARFRLRADNDGELDDTFIVRGPAGRGRVLARYSVGTTDVTAAVVAGREIPLAAGGHGFVTATIRVAPGAPHGLVRSFVLRTRSSIGHAEDRVIARIRVA
jgi:hypothetical protein